MLNDLLGWYIAPWRRMNRATFNVIMLVITLPGFALQALGWGDGLSGMAGHGADILDFARNLQDATGATGALPPQGVLEGLVGPGGAPATCAPAPTTTLRPSVGCRLAPL